MPPVTRFAPSPTGLLHLGHAYSAQFAAEAAGLDGQFLLRIEGIDGGRSRPEFEAAIYEDLAWLGLEWETPVRRQAEHFSEYGAAVAGLQRKGLLYPCFCTRSDIQREIANAASAPHPPLGVFVNGPFGPEGAIYPGTCRHMTSAEQHQRMDAGTPYALRLRMDDAMTRTGPLSWHDEVMGEMHATPDIFGDVVLARKDMPASYHLACTWDDALQGVTLVTRGEDLAPVTHIHRLLQALWSLPTPQYHHHALLMGHDGKKLSKRDQAPTLRALREAGKTKEDVMKLIGFDKTAHVFEGHIDLG